MDTFKRKLEELYSETEKVILQSYPDADTSKLRAAFEFANIAHEDQLRKSGEPYSIHPAEVALIVAKMNLDEDSVVSAFLHDTIEDTDYTAADIKERFGPGVAEMVEGVTKLTKANFSSKEEAQGESLRKMFLAMTKDIRVVMIKIADRLHNMRTSEYWKDEKRREKSSETMDLYAPIAYRLGIQKIKWELEDLSLKNLDPVAFAEITRELKKNEAHHTGILTRVQETISKGLEEAEVSAAINGRIKHIYSIYRKMFLGNKDFSQIFDIYAIRIITKSKADCYSALGIIHELYKPIHGRHKDYLPTPKQNGYQSIHTVVVGDEGIPFEVQIRTEEMHRVAEYGVAAHWQYKGSSLTNEHFNNHLDWVRRILETQEDSDPEEFIKAVKTDLFTDEVFVFTPKGDVKNLPAGAGVIDFAYAVHTEVGHHMTGARVNKKLVSLSYQLQNGDIVDIITGKSSKPSRDWLNLAKTNEAKNKIKQWFKRENYEENVAFGKAAFENELKRSGISMDKLRQKDVLVPTLKQMNHRTFDDLYAVIGYGGTTATRVLNRFRDTLLRLSKEERQTVKVVNIVKPVKKPVSGVIVEGLDNVQIKFSRCCAPVPGDSICGFVTRGFGVSVHRNDCASAQRMKGVEESDRWVAVSWSSEIKETYHANMIITSRDRNNLIADVATRIAKINIPLRDVNARSSGDGTALIKLTAEVKGIEQINNIRNEVLSIDGILTAARV